MTNTKQYKWEIATDPLEVHNLLLASDKYVSDLENPPPTRNIKTTKQRVSNKQVHILRSNNEKAIAMFTLSPIPTFNLPKAILPPAEYPLYISRLAVSPKPHEQESIIGAQCLKKAILIAKTLGADAIRSEANPNLQKVVNLLKLFDFKFFFINCPEDMAPCIYLQKNIN